MSPRGLLIVFEGLDGAGKSTIAHTLRKLFNKKQRSLQLFNYPDRRTHIGELIDLYLTKKIVLEKHAAHLLFAANRWETIHLVIDSLTAESNVVLDRYIYSGVAYSAAKPGMDLDWCKQSDKGLPKPDLVCFFDTSKTLNRQIRNDYGDEIYENEQDQSRVRIEFNKLFDTSMADFADQPYIIVNPLDSIEKTTENIYDKIEELEAKGITKEQLKLI